MKRSLTSISLAVGCVTMMGARAEATANDVAPAFQTSIAPIDAERRAKMTGVTWREGCPVSLDDLVALSVSHWDFEGNVQQGLLIVAKSHAEGLSTVFQRLYDAKYPITSIRPAVEYGGDDNKIMAANNTSAFNCRAITGGTAYSEHSYGHALDLNPRINPYIKGTKVLPPEGAAYVNRDPSVPGLIVDGDAVVTAFSAIGWKWGGHWTSRKDYQHFSATGK